MMEMIKIMGMSIIDGSIKDNSFQFIKRQKNIIKNFCSTIFNKKGESSEFQVNIQFLKDKYNRLVEIKSLKGNNYINELTIISYIRKTVKLSKSMKIVRVSSGYFLNLESDLEKDFLEKEKNENNINNQNNNNILLNNNTNSTSNQIINSNFIRHQHTRSSPTINNFNININNHICLQNSNNNINMKNSNSKNSKNSSSKNNSPNSKNKEKTFIRVNTYTEAIEILKEAVKKDNLCLNTLRQVNHSPLQSRSSFNNNETLPKSNI